MPPQDNTKEQINALQQMSDATKSLQRATAKGNDAAQAQIKALESNSRGIKPMQRTMEGVTQAGNKLHGQLGAVGSELMGSFKQAINPMNLLSQAITDGISQADQYQTGALRLGMDTNKLIGKFPGDLSNVTGGFVAAMDSTFKQTESGMNSLGKHTSMAAVRTAALDGNLDGLIKSQRRMETSLGMDEEAVDRSSKRMIQLSQQYGISSDRLVNAMEALAKSESTMAALGIGEQTNKSVMELTAKFGAGNEKLIAEFTNSMLATGSKAVQHSVLGGIQDLQTAMMQGTATSEDLEKGILEQGNKYLNIVRGMQADGVQMNVALGQLEKLYGPGATAAMKLAQSYEKMTPEQIAKQKDQAKIQQDWGNTLKTMKEEVLTPIKVAITKNLPPMIKFFKKWQPLFKGILKGMMIVASSIIIKRGMGAMLGGAAGGDPLRAMMGAGAMAAGVGGLGTAVGVDAGPAAAVGVAAGMLPLLATMFSKNKGILGAAKYGFGKKGGETGMLAEKLGSASNPMHVIVVGGGLGDEGLGMSGRSLSRGIRRFSRTKWGKKIPGLRKAGEVLGKGFGPNMKNATKGIGSFAKRIGGKQVAKTAASFFGKRMAAAAAVQVVPVVGQVVGAGLAIWTATEIGLSLWKKRKEKRAEEMSTAIAGDLHDRQKARIRAELEAFNKGLQKHDNYLKITNDELRQSMRKALSGRTEKQVLDDISNSAAETVRGIENMKADTEEVVSNTTPALGDETGR